MTMFMTMAMSTVMIVIAIVVATVVAHLEANKVETVLRFAPNDTQACLHREKSLRMNSKINYDNQEEDFKDKTLRQD